jgi:hypothetical protein
MGRNHKEIAMNTTTATTATQAQAAASYDLVNAKITPEIRKYVARNYQEIGNCRDLVGLAAEFRRYGLSYQVVMMAWQQEHDSK